jgi:hypothetical protein
LQRVAHNKANECLTTNWDSALDPKKAPRTKIQETETKKTHKHGKRKNFLNVSDL